MATNNPDHIPTVTPTQAHHRGPGVVLLDVREPDEHTAGHPPGARHVPLSSLLPEQLAAAGAVWCLCRSGRRSATATADLRAAGIDARNDTGGMLAWAADQLPIETSDGHPGAVL